MFNTPHCTKVTSFNNYIFDYKIFVVLVAFRSGFGGGQRTVPIDCAILLFLGTGIKRGHVLKATIGVGPSNL
jgi:hypothetical protein